MNETTCESVLNSPERKVNVKHVPTAHAGQGGHTCPLVGHSCPTRLVYRKITDEVPALHNGMMDAEKEDVSAWWLKGEGRSAKLLCNACARKRSHAVLHGEAFSLRVTV